MKDKLAILGGEQVRSRKFPGYNTIGKNEFEICKKVLEKGVISDFLAKWGDQFYGGQYVQELEQLWAKKCNTKYAVSMNSATSCLMAGAGALELGPGDEVIVSPWTMTATATAALVFNAIPVFADIQDDIFNLDPKSIENKITRRTKAIFVTHIFGHPADMDSIKQIAGKYDLKIMEDAAQAPFVKYKDQYVGRLGDIGVFSLNYHKHIHTGEGGIAVTDNPEIYEKLLLIRNHGEMAATARNLNNIINILGFNFRMTEIQAAIGIEQVKKFDILQKKRLKNIEYLNEKLTQLPGINAVTVYSGCEHGYYVHPFKYDEGIVGVERNIFIDAVRAELPLTQFREQQGPLLFSGYIKPIYMLKLYQNQILYGTEGCPFKCQYYRGKLDYKEGICPTAERLHNRELFFHEMFRPPMDKSDLDDVVKAFYKVYDNREQLLLYF